jgi:diacylglycerol O-acyltransferase
MFGLSHPLMVDDPGFDIRNHYGCAQAAEPGDDRALCAVISEFASAPIDRSRPLWSGLFVERLSGGRTASIVKLHHALADGGASVSMLNTALDHDPDETRLPEAPVRVGRGSSELPSTATRFVWSLGAFLRGILRFPQVALEAVKDARRVAEHLAGSEASMARVFDTPKLSFNRALTAQRAFAVATLPLADMLQLKRDAGATLNDVFLAVCGGALRRYLSAVEELPDRPLIASIPASTDDADGDRIQGNAVSSMFSVIGVDQPDPIERLRQIQKSMGAAKEAFALRNVRGDEWASVLPPALFSLLWQLLSFFKLWQVFRPPINLILSNVPGPRETLYRQGHRVEAIWSVGPLVEGGGLNITSWSYEGQMVLGILACPEHADVWRIAEAIPEAYAELRERVVVDA